MRARFCFLASGTCTCFQQSVKYCLKGAGQTLSRSGKRRHQPSRLKHVMKLQEGFGQRRNKMIGLHIGSKFNSDGQTFTIKGFSGGRVDVQDSEGYSIPMDYLTVYALAIDYDKVEKSTLALEPGTCPKINECSKIKIVLTKSFDYEPLYADYAEFILKICAVCQIEPKVA